MAAGARRCGGEKRKGGSIGAEREAHDGMGGWMTWSMGEGVCRRSTAPKPVEAGSGSDKP
jgi:hypothetical protein